MQVREFLNRNPAIAVVSVVVLIGVCIWVIWGQTANAGPSTPNKSYYTVDDGKSWFVDDIALLAPFQKDGKDAVRAHLFQCGKGSPVVGYLERYTAKGKEVTQRYQSERAANPTVPPPSLGAMTSLGQGAREVKKPGDAKWINMREGAAIALMRYKCEDGSEGSLVRP